MNSTSCEEKPKTNFGEKKVNPSLFEKLKQTLAKSFDKEKHGAYSGRAAASGDDDELEDDYHIFDEDHRIYDDDY